MSFDLYFCWQTNAKVDFGAVSAWANQQGNFNRKDNQLWYDNPITGVYFSLDFDPQGPTTPEESPIPPGYYDSPAPPDPAAPPTIAPVPPTP